ncbi:MAG: hypothetical protein HKN83_01275, partial [Gammaproteobacteria bacterium]|nr:hypothetical protein [Gammaproteobacteria bacterium]
YVDVITNTGQIERRLVTTGYATEYEYIEVLSGLTEHEEVQITTLN